MLVGVSVTLASSMVERRQDRRLDGLILAMRSTGGIFGAYAREFWPVAYDSFCQRIEYPQKLILGRVEQIAVVTR
jgi:hypothetical protein